jgi:hypothetical protein
METGGGSRKAGGKGNEVRMENVGSSSELSLSTASNSTLKDAPEGNTTDAMRRKERKERREEKLKKREKHEQEKKLQEKLSRKEARRITREERAKRKKKPMGEAHIGHEWDSSKESSE